MAGRIKATLKSLGSTLLSLFGFDSFKKSDNGQKLMDSANEFTDTLCGKKFFQTNKEKEAAEKRAKEIERANLAKTAENTEKIAGALSQLNDIIKKLWFLCCKIFSRLRIYLLVAILDYT